MTFKPPQGVHNLLQDWHWHWGTLNSLLNGDSAIDARQLPIEGPEQAKAFLKRYGYDTDSASDVDFLRHLQARAVGFIEQYFLDSSQNWPALRHPEHPEVDLPDTHIPYAVAHVEHPIELVLMAASDSLPLAYWAGAVLKVMHTWAHILNGPLYAALPQATDQILSAYREVITWDEAQNGYLLGLPDSPYRLPLAGFEFKDSKSQESMLIKLLCKKTHVAEQVEDLVGVRLITRNPQEALLALSMLVHFQVMAFPNIIPGRSRNALLHLQSFQAQWEALCQKPELQHADWPAFLQHLGALILPESDKAFSDHNPSSSSHYKSIHLTCRQLIEVAHALPGQHGGFSRERLFFPYEIQLIDVQNYAQSQAGDSAHKQYKLRQLAKARRRVLGPLLEPKTDTANTVSVCLIPPLNRSL